jgi:1-acyl-sn-glycerol-3-phosphate acyltransferase
MIPASKSTWFSRWFAGHAEKRLRVAFSEVRIRGLGTMRAALGRGPVLVVSNHTAWWDPMVSLVLCQRILRADAYAMMDAANLRKLPFFAKVGAFGVALDDPADGARGIRYAAKRLDGPGRLLWVFAQGHEVPVTAGPIAFRPGSAEIARLARDAAIVPVGLRYEHGAVPEPGAWVSIGDALERADVGARFDANGARREQELAVDRELGRIDRAIVHGDAEGFDVVLRKTESPRSRMAQAMLAWMTRPPRQL